MVNMGIIGCGYWGPNLIRNMLQLRDVNLKIVSDLSEERLEYVASHYPTIKMTKSYKELLSDSSIEVVVIATPASTHYPITKECLLAEKHVLVEKPLSLNVDNAKELIDIARKVKRILMVSHTFEYNAAVRKVKDCIKKGELGEIYYIYSQRLNLGRVRKDINAMWNLAPHDISIILFWLEEEPVTVTARGRSYLQEDIEDVVFLNLDFKNGKSAHIHTSWLDPGKIRKMTVVGSKKMIIYDDVSSDRKIHIYDKGIDKKSMREGIGRYEDFGEFQLLQRAGNLLIPKVDFVEPLRTECEHFVDCIVNNKKPLTDGENGLRVVKVLEAGQRSLENDGMPITL